MWSDALLDMIPGDMICIIIFHLTIDLYKADYRMVFDTKFVKMTPKI